MENAKLPEDCAKQWELILLLLSSEEKNIDKTGESEVDMMAYFYNNEAVRKILYQWLWQMRASSVEANGELDTATKSDHIALIWRQRGNDKFRTNDMTESYNYYTKSVLYARRDGGDLFALALANRSAALLRLHRYKECLMDTELALECGYPEKQQHKLLLRQADSHIELNNIREARAALDLAARQVDTMKLNSATRKDLERNIKLLEKKILAGGSCAEDTSDVAPECFLGQNQRFVNASAALELRKNESCGRHVVANTEVQRGNVLFVEDPYAFVALPVDSLLPIVCETCCESNINIVPCCVCSRSVYCSERCRAAGWQRFHRWECVGAQSRLWPTIGIAHLALRVLVTSTNSGFPATGVDLGKSVTASDVFESYSRVDKVEAYGSGGAAFCRVFHLVTNFDKTSNTDYIQYALTATMLTVYLEVHTKYFDYLASALPWAMSEGEMRVLAAALLLRHMGQLVCNGHAVMALGEGPGGGRRTGAERETRLATAIYPVASMMNHSCDPNIVNSFQRCRLVVKASRGVPAAAEVYNCYGPAYTREPLLHRRAQLRAQYHFTCACPACTDPDKRDFILLFGAYSCHACKGPVLVHNKRPCCKQCKSTALNLDRTLALLQHADDLLKQAELCAGLVERCDKLLAALKLKQQALHRHHTALRDITDQLACLYAEQGEWGRSAEMIKQCVPTLEYQFGSHSVEVAHELRKLADVMLQRLMAQPLHADLREWCLETNKITKKALQLLELNYGPWDAACRRLRANERAVRAQLARQPAAAQRDPSVHDLLHYNLKI